MTHLLAITPSDPPAGTRPIWPEPLVSLAARGLVHIHAVATLHEAAARLSLTAHPDFAALIIDTESLTHREIGLLKTFKRHKNLPIWLLPVCSIARPRYQEALTCGATPWKDVLLALAGLPLNSFTHQAQKSSTQDSDLFPDPPKTHNNPLEHAKNSAEILVEPDLTSRYDETEVQPLLSEQEMRALLGTAE